MPTCTVCSHPERRAIDRALLAGNATYESLSDRFGPSLSALFRHKKHLRENILQARQRLDNNLRLGFLFKLNNFLARTEKASQQAEAADNVDQVLKAARVGSRIIHDLSKMESPWDLDTVYRVLASPQWTTQDCLLPTDPVFLAAGHQTLADNLFHPCPEPPPVLDDEEDDDEAVPCVGPESLAPSSLSPEILAHLHPDLLATVVGTLSQPPNPATPPRRQREISAKSARKSRSTRENNKLNQKDKSTQKNTLKKAPNLACKPSTRISKRPELETSPHESLFDRLRRKWAKTKPSQSLQGSCDSEALYQQHLQDMAAVGTGCNGDRESESPPAKPVESAAPPADPGNVGRESGAQLAISLENAAPPPIPDPRPLDPDPYTPDPGPPDPHKPLNPFTHPGDYLFALTHGYRRDNPPKHIPDRRWEEDFGNPRKFKGY